MTKNRTLASIISNDTSKIKTVYTDSDSVVTSASLGVTAASGTTTYSSADTLPAVADNGDQALVTSTNRLYIFTNGGWYNIAIINNTPYWLTEPATSYDLSKVGQATTVTILAGDSDGTNPVYTAVTDSDFDNIATITKDSDNGRVFYVIPIDSEGGTSLAGSGIVTFKASDGISLVQAVSTFSMSFSVGSSNYTTLLVKADTAGTDNQVDASTIGRTVTEYADATSTAYTPYHPGGYSTYFDGSGDYLQIPDNNGFELDGDFTIECWFYRSAVVSGTYSSIIGGNGSTSNGWNIYITNSNGAISFFHSSFLLTYVEGVQNDTWYHVAVTRSGTDLKLFVNGIERQAITNSSTFNQNSQNLGTRIGYDISANGYFNGYIRDVRVVKGTAVYTSAFTPPTAPLTAITNTELLTCHLPYIADKSTNNHVITVAGNTSTTRFSPYDYEVGYTKADHGGSVYFDGAGDYIDVPAVTDLRHDQGDWTMELWYYPITTSSAIMLSCMGQYLSALNFSCYTNTNGSLGYEAGSGGWSAAAAYNGTAGALTAKKWHHIVYTRHNGNLRAYVNGVLNISADGATFGVNANLSNIIGSNFNTGLYAYGYISDYRFVQGTAVYTAAFTPPTEPLTAITNTKLLTCTNKNSIWDASGARELITVGGTAAASNTQRQFTSSSAIVYDGNSDYLEIPANDFFNFGTDDFTMETWVHAVATGNSYPSFMSSITGWSAGANGHRFDNTGYANKFAFYVNGFGGRSSGNPFMHTTNNFSHDTWYHYAVTRSGNTFRMFIDGVLEDTQTSSGSLNIGLGGFRSGWSFDGANGYFNGYIQDMRITRGLARYTSSFTPTTAEFEG